MKCLHGQLYRTLKKLSGCESIIELFIVMGAFLLVTSMTNVQSNQTQTSSPQLRVQYDYTKPVIDPTGENGYAGLNVTIFGNKTVTMCLDTGAAGFSYVDPDLVPPDWERLELPHPVIANGIGGNGSAMTQSCLLPITLPDGRQVHVTALIMKDLSVGVLLGVPLLRKLRAKFHIPDSMVSIAGRTYPITYLNGFHPINSTEPNVQLSSWRSKLIPPVVTLYSAFVRSTRVTATLVERQKTSIWKQRELDGEDQVSSWDKAGFNNGMYFTDNFVIVEPQNSTIYLPEIALP